MRTINELMVSVADQLVLVASEEQEGIELAEASLILQAMKMNM